MKLARLVVVVGLFTLSACGAKSKPCLDQLQACGERALNCAIQCAAQGGCVVDQCYAERAAAAAQQK